MNEISTLSTSIPLVDLKAQRAAISQQIEATIARVLDRCEFILGEDLHLFEMEFAEYCEVPYAIGVASGTDALYLACRALDLDKDDEVIVPAMTFASTAFAVSLAGARPVLVDVRAEDGLIDPDRIEAAVTPRTKAIIPVHLYGQCADMTAVCSIAAKYSLAVIEDAAQAHGAIYAGRRAGSLGDIGCFSFYPGKNLGACGEGGAVTTNDGELASKVAMIRDHGQAKKYYHDVEGYNGRLDSIQAGMLRVKLQHLTRWNEQRRESARVYDELLAPMNGSVVAPHQSSFSKSVYHLYVVRTPFRDELQKHLGEAGIGTGIHYPIPVHLQRAYASMDWKNGDLPETEQAADQILSLPLFAGLKPQHQQRVVETIAEFASIHSSR